MKIQDDIGIEGLKKFYHYDEIVKKFEKDTVDLYKSEDMVDRLIHMGVNDEKYHDDKYLRKISPINYIKYIYENFQILTKGKYKECEILNLPSSSFNGTATLTKDNVPVIELDFYFLQTIHLICYSFVTSTFVKTKKFTYNDEFKSPSDVYIKTIIPAGVGFIKYFITRSLEDLFKGFEAVDTFSKENWKIFNNSVLLANAIILFIILHEQAHHELGHCKDDSRDESRVLTDAEIQEKKDRELEADGLAISIFMECIDPESSFGLFNCLENFYLAPFYFFEMLHSIEWLLGEKGKNELYPTAKERYMNLLNNFDYEKYKKDVPVEDIELWYDYFQELIKLATI